MGFVDLPGEPTTVRIHGDYGEFTKWQMIYLLINPCFQEIRTILCIILIWSVLLLNNLLSTIALSFYPAVVGVNTSPDYVNPSGLLAIIDINSKSIIQEIDLFGVVVR